MRRAMLELRSVDASSLLVLGLIVEDVGFGRSVAALPVVENSRLPPLEAGRSEDVRLTGRFVRRQSFSVLHADRSDAAHLHIPWARCRLTAPMYCEYVEAESMRCASIVAGE